MQRSGRGRADAWLRVHGVLALLATAALLHAPLLGGAGAATPVAVAAGALALAAVALALPLAPLAVPAAVPVARLRAWERRERAIERPEEPCRPGRPRPRAPGDGGAAPLG